MKTIINDFFKQRKRSFYKRPRELDKNLKQAFLKIKREFEEHLQAINENTNEIQSNYEYFCEVDGKMDKLAERIEKIQLYLQSNTNFYIDGEKTFDIKP